MCAEHDVEHEDNRSISFELRYAVFRYIAVCISPHLTQEMRAYLYTSGANYFPLFRAWLSHKRGLNLEALKFDF